MTLHKTYKTGLSQEWKSDFLGETGFIRNQVACLLLMAYLLGYVATFVKLTFLDGQHYTLWNWIYLLPLKHLFAVLWPIYWPVAHML